MDADDYASDAAMAVLACLQDLYDEFEQQASCPVAYRVFVESSHAYIRQTIHDHDEHEHQLIMDVHTDMLQEAFQKHFHHDQTHNNTAAIHSGEVSEQ